MKSAVSGLKRDGGWTPDREIVQLAAFTVGGESYALDIMRIKEIINPLPITPVPRSPPFIEGVIELRGVILPVVDMRKRFGREVTAPTRATKYLIVAIDRLDRSDRTDSTHGAAPPDPSQRWIVGLIVDGVQEVLRVPRSEILPAPPMALGPDARFFSGVCRQRDRIVMLIDLRGLLSPGELQSLDRLGGQGAG
jgi:purine-binding chemotaxis protein CheW